MSLIPKGGDAIWGTLDWAPEEDHNCVAKHFKKNDTQAAVENEASFDDVKSLHYGRIISFGKDIAEKHSSKVERVEFKVILE